MLFSSLTLRNLNRFTAVLRFAALQWGKRLGKTRRYWGRTICALLLAALTAKVATQLYVQAEARRKQWERITALNRAYPWYLSPNRDERSDPLGVNCIVLHATASTNVAQTLRILSDPQGRRVSAHYLVDKRGKVWQLVPVHQRAWHAGISELSGKPSVNDFSVGIEIMNRSDGRDPYTPAQYKTVARLIQQIRACYTVPQNRLVSHAHVARPHGRKSDPLGFDWPRLKRLLR
jgi:N-acetyl-anhydromuramyl-L-alanine amidase AmpD